MSSKRYLLFAAVGLVYAQTAGTTTTTWDSCEPACRYTSVLSPGARGPVKSCNKKNQPAVQKACFVSSGNLAFPCDTYQPIIVNGTLSYGSAGHGDTATSTWERFRAGV